MIDGLIFRFNFVFLTFKYFLTSNYKVFTNLMSIYIMDLNTQLKVTCDDEFLVSVAEDASIIVWKILDRALIGQNKVEKPYTMEILVLPPDIEKKARNY